MAALDTAGVVWCQRAVTANGQPASGSPASWAGTSVKCLIFEPDRIMGNNG